MSMERNEYIQRETKKATCIFIQNRRRSNSHYCQTPKIITVAKDKKKVKLIVLI